MATSAKHFTFFFLTVTRSYVAIHSYVTKPFLLFALITAFILGCGPDQAAIKKRTEQVIGVYSLDTSKTNLGPYKKDVELYSNLVLTMSSDSTFHFNMRVPFMEDSFGKWNMSDGCFECWNYMYPAEYDLSKYRINIGIQFSSLPEESSIAIVQKRLDSNDYNSMYRWFRKIQYSQLDEFLKTATPVRDN